MKHYKERECEGYADAELALLDLRFEDYNSEGAMKVMRIARYCSDRAAKTYLEIPELGSTN